jgi:hypothetical protein
MTEDQIKHMVNRFLGWRLPKPWNPDNGISYQRPNYAHAPAEHDWPTGTNLFDASQAEAMIRYVIDGMPSAFVAEDFAHTAHLIRSAPDEPQLKAFLANNLNIILAALDAQGR